LAERFPALFSHLAGSVHAVVTTDLRGLFQRRLTAQAATQLQLLQDLLNEVNLDGSRDARFEDGDHRLMSSLIYRTSTRGVLPSSLSGETLRPRGSRSSVGCWYKKGSNAAQPSSANTSWKMLAVSSDGCRMRIKEAKTMDILICMKI
jgi:hypothetical protein